MKDTQKQKKNRIQNRLWALVVARWAVKIGTEIEPLAKEVTRLVEKVTAIEPVRLVFQTTERAVAELVAEHPEVIKTLLFSVRTFWWSLLYVIPCALILCKFFSTLRKWSSGAKDAVLRLHPRTTPREHLILHVITPDMQEAIVDLNHYSQASPYVISENYSAYKQNGMCYIHSKKTGQTRCFEEKDFVGDPLIHLIKVTSVKV